MIAVKTSKNKYIIEFLLVSILMIMVSCSSIYTKTEIQGGYIKNWSVSPILSNAGDSNEQSNLTPIQINQQLCNTNLKLVDYNSSGLLSPRVYAGLLEPQSYLITNFGPLKSELREFMLLNNINGSVYIENLRNGVNIGINQNRGYFPASLNKLPVAVIIMQKIEEGRLSFDTLLSIENSERSSDSGILYLSNATKLTVRELFEKMLKESDNTAFNVLYDNVDKDELRKLLQYYDVNINVDYPYRRIEFINHTDQVTPISMYNLFSSLYLSTVLAEPKDSEYILSLLANSDFDIKSMANLPSNITLAQKYGEYYTDDTKQFHDCGIMYIDRSRIFYCIMTKDLDAEDAKTDIGYMINRIYYYVVYARSELDLLKKQNSKTS